MSVVESAREQLLSSGSWSVDPAHSTIEFRVKHMVICQEAGQADPMEGGTTAAASVVPPESSKLLRRRTGERFRRRRRRSVRRSC